MTTETITQTATQAETKTPQEELFGAIEAAQKIITDFDDGKIQTMPPLTGPIEDIVTSLARCTPTVELAPLFIEGWKLCERHSAETQQALAINPSTGTDHGEFRYSQSFFGILQHFFDTLRRVQNPESPPPLESIAKLNEQGVSIHQIARMHNISATEAFMEIDKPGSLKLPDDHETDHDRRIRESGEQLLDDALFNSALISEVAQHILIRRHARERELRQRKLNPDKFGTGIV
ncbi:hypothetical protein Mal52_51220 [Symmachiella dynata]|uniref:Uncharacterized protein n=1 Tax=Symmachiella dynata TaxID=2527995 RepID=A0A517ZVU8_9PLAN|nr:hypothetical protein [Symmachiella dynata]QDU46600.1 hypothetical protein Mal52_51220 [Symmachiella dynata]